MDKNTIKNMRRISKNINTDKHKNEYLNIYR